MQVYNSKTEVQIKTKSAGNSPTCQIDSSGMKYSINEKILNSNNSISIKQLLKPNVNPNDFHH